MKLPIVVPIQRTLRRMNDFMENPKSPDEVTSELLKKVKRTVQKVVRLD